MSRLYHVYGPYNPHIANIDALNSDTHTCGYIHIGYIDVGDGCWRPNVLVTSFRC